MVKREVMTRYKGSFLGLFWSLINPILMLAVYTFVFSVVFTIRLDQDNDLYDSKTSFAIVLFAGLIAGCQNVNNSISAKAHKDSSEILFQVKTTDKDDLEVFEDGIIPWLSIENPELDIPNLIGKDEIVVNTKVATFIIDYPLNKPVEIEIKSNNPKGFTRKELALIISTEYKRI